LFIITLSFISFSCCLFLALLRRILTARTSQLRALVANHELRDKVALFQRDPQAYMQNEAARADAGGEEEAMDDDRPLFIPLTGSTGIVKQPLAPTATVAATHQPASQQRQQQESVVAPMMNSPQHAQQQQDNNATLSGSSSHAVEREDVMVHSPQGREHEHRGSWNGQSRGTKPRVLLMLLVFSFSFFFLG
jgi:hypothetical protein